MIFTGRSAGGQRSSPNWLGTCGASKSPIEFEIADDLGWWTARIPGKMQARGEALVGPTTLSGLRVQVHNPPGAETGPGGVATQGVAVPDQA
jgi:hypothetical protein